MSGAVLIDNEDNDTVSDPFVSSGGQFVVVIRAATFGPAIVAIQYSARPLSSDPLVSRWKTIQNGVYTTDAELRLDYIPSGHGVRAVLTDTGTSPAGTTDDVFCEIKQ